MAESSSNPSGQVHQTKDSIEPQDTKTTFLGIPWIASQISQPDVICRTPRSREPKSSTEDSLWAEILKDPRTISSCIFFYKKPVGEVDHVEEASVAMTVGDGMNGHPAILHGGITATMLDEVMGMYQAINIELVHLAKVKSGDAERELSPGDYAAFTAELKIKYLRPVLTPGNMVVTVRRVKKEGRKQWLAAELKQCTEQGGEHDGEVVICATGEALFISPRVSKI